MDAALQAWFADETDTVEAPLPADFKVVVKLENPGTEDVLFETSMLDEITGLVINDIESIDSEIGDLIVEFYPGLDLDQCWIFEVDRKPAGPGKVYGLMGGGLALLLFAAGLGLKLSRS